MKRKLGKRMLALTLSALVAAGGAGAVLPAAGAPAGSTAMTESEVYDKILGGWAGQMIGVGWSGPTEFKAQGRILEESEIPEWKPSMINDGLWQDDLYVEIPFMDALKDNGVDCDIKTVGEYFRDTSFALYHANLAARVNLRAGIDAPDSGSYLYNDHSDDLDWQIEADFVGQMVPGLTNAAIEKAWELGHITNYGDGVYGGVYVSAMHAKAFTAKTLDEILEAGRQSVPQGSQFRAAIEDVYTCYEAGKTWRETWRFLEDKWGGVDHCIDGAGRPFNIDAKLNAAYILVGMLYGEGDFEQTMKISMMCGQDSDCNPSSAASILGNWMGFKAIPDKWKSDLTRTGAHFSYTKYDFDGVVDLNMELAREAFVRYGGTIDGDDWVIPAEEEIVPPPLEQLPELFPLSVKAAQAGSQFTFDLYAHDQSRIESASWDFGDGSTGEGFRASHKYERSGIYEVTCTVISTEGEAYVRDKTITAGRNIASKGTAAASVVPQGGGGNTDINVIADGVRPDAGNASDKQQFDTYRWTAEKTEQWIGYTFEEEHTIGMVVFQEGNHFVNGGWFENGLRLQVLRDGVWTDVEAAGSPEYPVADDRASFGEPFEVFNFFLDNETCTGVRVIGTPGGSECFVSCAELEVYEAGSADSDDPAAHPSPALPAVEGHRAVPLFSMNNYEWDWDTTMVISPDDVGCLVLQNVDGQWPKADCRLSEPVTFRAEGASVWYDFVASIGVDTSIVLFFGGEEGGELDNAKSVVINPAIDGVGYNAGSGDIVGNGKRVSGRFGLTELEIPANLLTDGNLTLIGARVYVAGAAYTPVTLGQFALLLPEDQTPTDPTNPTDPTDPTGSTTPTEPFVTDPANPTDTQPSENPAGTGSSTAGGDTTTAGAGAASPATGEGMLPVTCALILIASAVAVVLFRRNSA